MPVSSLFQGPDHIILLLIFLPRSLSQTTTGCSPMIASISMVVLLSSPRIALINIKTDATMMKINILILFQIKVFQQNDILPS